MILRPSEGVAPYAVDHGSRVVAHAALAEVIALRRCAMYRNAFRGVAIGYPATAMRLEAVAGWMRRQGVTVDVTDVDDLDWTAFARILPSHVVMHGLDEVSCPIALGYGVSRIIVESAEQMALLGQSATRPEAVLVDVTESCMDAVSVADSRLQIDGLHRRVEHADVADLADIVFSLIAQMARVSDERATPLSRLSIDNVDLTGSDHDPRSLRGVAETIDEAVEEACVKFCCPRPALTVSPRPSTLLPGA
jgi:diaminopimelate decarboxylase